MKSLSILFVSTVLGAQSITVTPSATVVYPGESLTATISLAGNAQPAAIQWTAPFSDLTHPVGTAATAASKEIRCATVNGATSCVVFGYNAIDRIGDGVLSTVQLPTTTPGTLQIGLANVLAASQSGEMIALTSAAVSVIVTSRCDINKSGAVDAADITAYLPQVLGAAPCTQPLLGNGKCNVGSLMVVINAAQPGGSCAAR